MLSSSEPVPDAVDTPTPTPTPTHTASTIVAEGVSGSHVLTVQGYSHTIGNGVCGPIPSSLFSLGGHTWRVQYYPDGVSPEHDDWISVSLSLHHTDAAKTQVKVRCRFSLLDQAGEPVPEYTTPYQARRCHADGHGVTSHRFIRRDDLESSAYLRDDRFSIRCDASVATGIRTQPGGTTTTTTPFAVTPPPSSSDMAHQLGRILETGEGADVTFEVGGETVAAHRAVLAARSSVFAAELFGPMKGGDDAACSIRIDDMEPKVFRMMLGFVYTDALPSIDDSEVAEMAQHLFVAADRYNLERLKSVCQNTLCRYMDARMVATTLALAEQHGCDELKEACHRFLASFQNLKAAIATDGFEHLKSIRPNILQELLQLQTADAELDD